MLKINSISIITEQENLKFMSVKIEGSSNTENNNQEKILSYIFDNYTKLIPKESKYSLLGNVTPKQYVIDTVKSIQSNFNKIFRK